MSEKLIHWSLSLYLAGSGERRRGEARQGWVEHAVSLAKSQHAASGARPRQVTHLNSIPRDPELDDDKNRTMSLARPHVATCLSSHHKI